MICDIGSIRVGEVVEKTVSDIVNPDIAKDTGHSPVKLTNNIDVSARAPDKG